MSMFPELPFVQGDGRAVPLTPGPRPAVPLRDLRSHGQQVAALGLAPSQHNVGARAPVLRTAHLQSSGDLIRPFLDGDNQKEIPWLAI